MSIKMDGKIQGGFKEAYNSLPFNRLKLVKNLIMVEMSWGKYTFENKRLGRSALTKPEAAVLEKIFAEYNLNPWTGEKLN